MGRDSKRLESLREPQKYATKRGACPESVPRKGAMTDDPDEVDAIFGEAMDVILEAEGRASSILLGLTDDQLSALASSAELAGGTLGNFMGSIARSAAAYRRASDYMQATGAASATWPEVHAWAAKKGEA